MIKELHINNWKSFDNSILYIDPLTIIIGTNASGKSNILDAFLMLFRSAMGLSIQSAISGDQVTTPIRGGSEWFIRKGADDCTLSVLVDSESKNFDYKYEIKLKRNSEKSVELSYESLWIVAKGEKSQVKTRQLYYSVGEGSPVMVVYWYSARQGKPKRIDMNRAYSTLSQVDKLPVLKEIKEAAAIVKSALQDIFILDPIPSNMRDVSLLDGSLRSDAKNIAGVLAALNEAEKERVEGLLTKYLKPLPESDINKVWAEKTGLFQNYAMLYCEEGWTESQKNIVDASGMSDGTLRFLAIITALILGKEGSLLIIEEIDNGLHPSRAKNLVAMLKELGAQRKIDVLCTTHNPALIDALEVEMIPFIQYINRNNETGNSQIKLLEDMEMLPKLLATYSVGELMTINKIK
ncbi:ABC transport protein, ATP-binding subunit [Mucinivorans hirudinis]|uniref:ABC transport protein, ATP-binding subunit n=1 Tax=Mucinivorans hirudinis TaxID=1433126 RepID=A0A060R9B4_9BACT|nr:ABC transport protein, ATP-binding subunit [Mucinivorans hirudinis]